MEVRPSSSSSSWERHGSLKQHTPGSVTMILQCGVTFLTFFILWSPPECRLNFSSFEFFPFFSSFFFFLSSDERLCFSPLLDNFRRGTSSLTPGGEIRIASSVTVVETIFPCLATWTLSLLWTLFWRCLFPRCSCRLLGRRRSGGNFSIRCRHLYHRVLQLTFFCFGL